jgi:transglutaminase-like putative cysteine protease
MRYSITHTTTYDYSELVVLQPHVLRLCPRSDSHQRLDHFDVRISHQPLKISDYSDLDGNRLMKLWFDLEPCSRLEIVTSSDITTLQSNPFIYLMDSYASQLPIDYPTSLALQLQSYLRPQVPIDPVAIELAQDIALETKDDVTRFLMLLNQRINESCDYAVREMGRSLPPGITWRSRKGTCRDFTVLFMEVCRAANLAARFVSGYQEGDLAAGEHYLHAWAEVYLPGAGWRGYDPTLGVLVSDQHIAIASSVEPSYAAPVTGGFRPAQAITTMNYQLRLREITSPTP